MITKTFRALYCVAAACLAGFGTPTWAGNWGGSFDPPHMFGTDLFNISGSDCLAGSPLLTAPVNTFYVNGWGPANNCVISLLNASVTLTSDTTTQTVHLTFADDGITSGQIFGIDLKNDGTLLGIDSFPIGPQFPSSDFDPVFNGPWYLQFDAHDGLITPDAIDNVVNLLGGTCFEVCSPDSVPTYVATYTSSFAGGTVFVPVPEPGSLALLAGALGAGWLTRRRRVAR